MHLLLRYMPIYDTIIAIGFSSLMLPTDYLEETKSRAANPLAARSYKIHAP